MDDPVTFTPPMADVAAQTEPGLWDGMDLSEFDVARALRIERMQPADRMLLMLTRKDLTPTSRIVGAVLAYHGWVSWPSLDTLVALLSIDKRNISRSIGELERHGSIRRSKRFGTRGAVSIQYVFSGPKTLDAVDSDEAGELSKRVRIPRRSDHQNDDGAPASSARDHQNDDGTPASSARDHQNDDGTPVGPVRDHQNDDGVGVRDHHITHRTGILTGMEEEEISNSSSSDSGSLGLGGQIDDGGQGERAHDDEIAYEQVVAALEEYRGYLGAWKSEGAAVQFYAANPGRFAMDLADAQRRKESDTEDPRHRYTDEYRRRMGRFPWERA